ncbi:TRIO and F-actin-binding protein-like [Ylistrum balloti]|uniref:TRIO and F-actin-binding protein-like n=1 Tax=Ylistrum balloti TaxID=509963 RepID=UPI002905DED4|nr:TRIO and F-actin-binding protein-like [Ylistrum balloti]
MSSTDEELESGIGSMSVTGLSEQHQELGTDQPCGTVTNQGSSQAASTNQDDPQAKSTNQDDPEAKSTNQDDPQAKSTNQDDPQAKSTNQDDPQSSATHQQDDTQASNSQDEDQSFYEVAPICPADTVVAFASPHGYISKSSSKTGGWLLHSFDEVCERYKNNTEGLNILHLLTQANSPVCSGMASKQYNGGKKCIGSFQHRLVKELILETRPVADEDEAVDE